jgi:hypothetical protein
MDSVWVSASPGVGLAPVATLLAIWPTRSTALSETPENKPRLVLPAGRVRSHKAFPALISVSED